MSDENRARPRKLAGRLDRRHHHAGRVRDRHARLLVRPRRGSSGRRPALLVVGAIVGCVLVEARLRRQGRRSTSRRPTQLECSTNSSPEPSPTLRRGALRAASPQVEAAALARPPALDARRRPRARRPREDHRRGQAREPVAAAPSPRSPTPRPSRSRTSRGSERDQRADRGPPVRRLARRPRAVRDAVDDPGAAQGLHRRAVPGVRGARRRRRPRAAHRRRARAARAARACTRSSPSSA